MRARIPIIAILATLLSIQIAFAGVTTVTISGKHTVSNNSSLKTGTHTFVLASKNGAPMPSDSVNGTKRVTVSSNESFSFGEINYPEDGTYEYTITRLTDESEELQEDASSYSVQVLISHGESTIIYVRDGDNAKSDSLTFSDDYYCTLTFDLGGGNLNGQTGTITQKFKLGDTITLPEAPTKKGYVFDYWKGSKYYAGQQYKITENHKFEAIYKVAATDKNNNKDKNTRSVKTGDNGDIFIYIGLFFMAVISLAVLKLKRR